MFVISYIHPKTNRRKNQQPNLAKIKQLNHYNFIFFIYPFIIENNESSSNIIYIYICYITFVIIWTMLINPY